MVLNKQSEFKGLVGCAPINLQSWVVTGKCVPLLRPLKSNFGANDSDTKVGLGGTIFSLALPPLHCLVQRA